MNELIHIGNSDITVKEYNGQRVVTFKDIDMVHGRPDGTARKRFADNRSRFIEGEDYFRVCASEIRTYNIMDISPKAHQDIALITEQGYLMLVKSFTDDLAWQVQRQLVSSYFRVRSLVNDLSPQMQMLYGMLDQMAQMERQAGEAKREAGEAKQIASQAAQTTEAIKEAVKPVYDNWREGMNKKIARVQKSMGKPFGVVRGEMYRELERRAGCNLDTRLKNRQDRMVKEGLPKSQVGAANKIDVIESDKKLREVFEKIVMEYEVRFCA